MSGLKCGDVVVLNSGGPAMTVMWIEENRAGCVWFLDGKPQSDAFPPAVLRKHQQVPEEISVISVPHSR